MPDSELTALDPEPSVVKLMSGYPVAVHRLKTRELFRLLKVITHGAGGMVQQLDFSLDMEEFAKRLLAVIVIAIPDAENEFLQFLASMCEPAGLVKRPDGAKLTKQEEEANKGLWEKFTDELWNPEPMDFLELLEVIIRQEAPDLQALGKRIAALLATFAKLGADKEPTEVPPTPQQLAEHHSEASSPPPTISFPPSTGGPTTTSAVSPSADSDSASIPLPAESRPGELPTPG